MRTTAIRIASVITSLCLLLAISPAICQRARAAASRVRMHRQEQPAAHINDVDIMVFRSIGGTLTGMHVITGPTIIEVTDRAEPRAKTQIEAQTITVTPVK